MRKLLYLFMGCLLLAGCRGNRYYLDKVESLWGADPDSMMYYLLKVDSASLIGEDWIDYHYFRMSASYFFLMAMEQSRLDSILGEMKACYPAGHERAFHARQIEWVYYYNRHDNKRKADSLAGEMKAYIRTKQDSSMWHSCKFHLKWAMGEMDSAFYYIKEGAHEWKEVIVHTRLASLFETEGKADSAVSHYLRAMELDSTSHLYYLDRRIVGLLGDLKDTNRAMAYLQKVRERMGRADVPYFNLMKGDFWMEMHQPDSALKHYRIATETGNGFVATQAYERMAQIAHVRHADKVEFGNLRRVRSVWNDIMRW